MYNIYSFQEKDFENFCSVECLRKFVNETDLLGGEISVVGKIDMNNCTLKMCQYCGNYTHPSEYCHFYGTTEMAVENFLSVDDKCGELSQVYGELLYVRLGSKCSIQFENLIYTASMVPLKSDPESIKERKEFVYFWIEPETCQDIAMKLRKPDQHYIPLSKSFITDYNIVPGDGVETEFVSYLTKEIHYPMKMFYPFELCTQKCFWPIGQEHLSNTTLYNGDGTLFFAEIINENPEHPNLENILKEVDIQDIMAQQLPPVDEECKA